MGFDLIHDDLQSGNLIVDDNSISWGKTNVLPSLSHSEIYRLGSRRRTALAKSCILSKIVAYTSGNIPSSRCDATIMGHPPESKSYLFSC
jgi:hypothetical protein